MIIMNFRNETFDGLSHDYVVAMPSTAFTVQFLFAALFYTYMPLTLAFMYFVRGKPFRVNPSPISFPILFVLDIDYLQVVFYLFIYGTFLYVIVYLIANSPHLFLRYKKKDWLRDLTKEGIEPNPGPPNTNSPKLVMVAAGSHKKETKVSDEKILLAVTNQVDLQSVFRSTRKLRDKLYHMGAVINEIQKEKEIVTAYEKLIQLCQLRSECNAIYIHLLDYKFLDMADTLAKHLDTKMPDRHCNVIRTLFADYKSVLKAYNDINDRPEAQSFFPTEFNLNLNLNEEVREFLASISKGDGFTAKVNLDTGTLPELANSLTVLKNVSLVTLFGVSLWQVLGNKNDSPMWKSVLLASGMLVVVTYGKDIWETISPIMKFANTEQPKAQSFDFDPEYIVSLLGKIISICVLGSAFSSSWFQKSSYIETITNMIKKFSVLRSAGEVCSLIVDMFTELINHVSMRLFGCDLLNPSSTVCEEISKWCEDVKRFELELHDGSSEFDTDSFNRLLLLEERITMLMIGARSSEYGDIVYKLINIHRGKLTSMRNTFLSLNFRPAVSRQCPTGIMMFGQPGVGKSFIQECICHDIFHRGFTEQEKKHYGDDISRLMWYKPCGAKHANGYMGQPFGIIDDFLHIKDTIANPNTDISDWINWVNTVPMLMVSAELVLKAINHCKMLLCIASTNLRGFKDISSCTDVGALIRRCHLPVLVTMHTNYATPVTRFLGPWERKLDTSQLPLSPEGVPETTTDHYIFHILDLTKQDKNGDPEIQETLNYQQFLDRILKVYRKHQKQYLEKLNYMKNYIPPYKAEEVLFHSSYDDFVMYYLYQRWLEESPVVAEPEKYKPDSMWELFRSHESASYFVEVFDEVRKAFDDQIVVFTGFDGKEVTTFKRKFVEFEILDQKVSLDLGIALAYMSKFISQTWEIDVSTSNMLRPFDLNEDSDVVGNIHLSYYNKFPQLEDEERIFTWVKRHSNGKFFVATFTVGQVRKFLADTAQAQSWFSKLWPTQETYNVANTVTFPVRKLTFNFFLRLRIQYTQNFSKFRSNEVIRCIEGMELAILHRLHGDNTLIDVVLERLSVMDYVASQIFSDDISRIYKLLVIVDFLLSNPDACREHGVFKSLKRMAIELEFENDIYETEYLTINEEAIKVCRKLYNGVNGYLDEDEQLKEPWKITEVLANVFDTEVGRKLGPFIVFAGAFYAGYQLIKFVNGIFSFVCAHIWPASAQANDGTQKSFDQTGDALGNILSSASSYEVLGDNDNVMFNLTFVRGTMAMLNRHSLEMLLAKDQNSVLKFRSVKNPTNVFQVPVAEFGKYLKIERDIAFVLLSNKYVSAKRDIVKFFVSKNTAVPDKCYARMIVPRSRNACDVEREVRKLSYVRKVDPRVEDHMDKDDYRYYDTVTDKYVTSNEGFFYSNSLNAGDCGICLFLTDVKQRNERIIGIHAAGKTRTVDSYATAVYKEDVEKAWEHFTCDTGQLQLTEFFEEPKAQSKYGEYFEIISTYPNKSSQVTETALLKSPFHNLLGEVDLQPADLKSPLIDNVKRYSKEKPILDENLLSVCMKHTYLTLLNDRKTELPTFRKYTFGEAIWGIPGEKHFKSLAFSTSSGAPYIWKYKGISGKKTLLGNPSKMGSKTLEKVQELYTYIYENECYDSKLLCKKFDLTTEEGKLNSIDFSFLKNIKDLVFDVKDAISKAHKGLFKETLFIDYLKDELLRAGKATRVFSGSPLWFTIVVRMYLGNWLKFVMDNNTHNGIAVGINPFSEEWDFLAKRLKKFPNASDNDFGEYDTSQQSHLHMEHIDPINDMVYHYDELDSLVVYMVFYNISHSRHVTDSFVIIEWHGALPSGCPITAYLNSTNQQTLFRFAWCVILGDKRAISSFRDHVILMTFGDDGDRSVSDHAIKFFHPAAISDVMSKMGYNFTAGNKSGHGQIGQVEGTTFLKRGFVYNPIVGRIVGPLAKKSICKMLYWTKNRSNKDEIVSSNLEKVLLESSFHGKEYFEEVKSKIHSKCAEIHFPMPQIFDYEIAVATNAARQPDYIEEQGEGDLFSPTM